MVFSIYLDRPLGSQSEVVAFLAKLSDPKTLSFLLFSLDAWKQFEKKNEFSQGKFKIHHE